LKLDRRTVLVGGGAGIGLIVAISLWPRRLASDLSVRADEQAFGPFIKVADDGRITVAVPQTETGQGIWTALAQVVALELGARWDHVAVEPTPLAPGYGNPLAATLGWPPDIRITAASTSVRAFEQPMREAGATARTMMIEAAAKRWNVDSAECDTANGFVTCGPRKAGFGDLAEEAAGRRPPRRAPLREPRAGEALPRLDAPAKTAGGWRFASDVRLPGLLYGAARLAPPGGRLKTFSREAAERVPGVRHVSATDTALAVVADSWWAAEQALKAATPLFAAPASEPQLRPLFERTLAAGDARRWFSRGDYDGVTRGARTLAATYHVAPALHLGLEPLSATARATSDRVEVWAATLAPDAAREAAKAAAAGAEVQFYPMPAGEPGGRALVSDAIPLAVRLTRETGRPVQLTLSQSASQNADRPSGGAMARMTALPGAGGITAACKMRVAAADGFGAALASLSRRSRPPFPGKIGLSGAVPPYGVPNLAIEALTVPIRFTAGYMRGSPEREFCFFNESFTDELAHAAGIEPLAFRMAMLGGNIRLARCLQAAARRAQWDGGGRGSTMGLAGCSAFGSHIVLVANATIGSDLRVKVERLVAAVDCGRVINPSLVEQQVAGGLTWALGQALVPAAEWLSGMPRARPIGAVGLPRLVDSPEISVAILESREEPGGVSALGATVLAPAVANAIYAATGKRMRSLPFDPMAA